MSYMPSKKQIEKFMRESNAIEGEISYDGIGLLHDNDIEGAEFFLISDLTEENLKKTHGILFRGKGEKWGYKEKEWVGKYKPANNEVGRHTPPSYKRTPECMKKYFAELPSMDAFEAHNEFANIHPFFDGNGRMARLIWWWKSRFDCSENENLTFLHNYYYESLNHQNSRSRFK